MKRTFTILLLTWIAAGCNVKSELNQRNDYAIMNDSVTISEFGVLPDGRRVQMYTLNNTRGTTMKVINYGGIITSLQVPDKTGAFGDIVLGYDKLDGYLKDSPYFGALIGRFGNRIAKGKFTLDGKTYSLATNNGVNHLHGGLKGFDKVFWEIAEEKVADGVALNLSYVSPDMEEGYPGRVTVHVRYTLTNDNELKIDYKANTDKKTIVNLTQHTYFNLTALEHDVLRHELKINADYFLPVDSTLIPTGVRQPVAQTPFDFTSPSRIGSRINDADEQLGFAGGYDHCWILNDNGERLKHAASLYEPISGREVSVYTTQPGIQFYSGNFLDGSITGKNEKPYNFRTGLCLETQHFPDSPNKPEFPSVTLNPADTFVSQTVYRFSVRSAEDESR